MERLSGEVLRTDGHVDVRYEGKASVVVAPLAITTVRLGKPWLYAAETQECVLNERYGLATPDFGSGRIRCGNLKRAPKLNQQQKQKEKRVPGEAEEIQRSNPQLPRRVVLAAAACS